MGRKGEREEGKGGERKGRGPPLRLPLFNTFHGRCFMELIYTAIGLIVLQIAH